MVKYFIDRSPVIALWTLFIGMASVMISYADHYIDFTDQAFYLLHVEQPNNIKTVANFYYLYLAPLYDAVNGHIDLYRIMGIAILLLSSLPLALAMKTVIANSEWARFFPLYLISILCFYAQFILTPSYNWFNFIGLLLYVGGVIPLLLSNRTTRAIILSGLAIGLGGWVCFAAKPTTAAMLAAVYLPLLSILIYRKDITVKGACCSTLSAGMIVFSLAAIHFTFFDNPLLFITRVQNGLEALQLVQGGYGLADQLRALIRDGGMIITYSFRALTPLLVVLVLSFIIPRVRHTIKKHPQNAFVIFTIVFVVGLISKDFYQDNFIKSGHATAMMSALIALPLIYSRVFTGDLRLAPKWPYIICGLLILIITYLFKIGSNTSYLALLNMQSALVLIAMILLLQGSVSACRAGYVMRFYHMPLFALLFIASMIQNFNHPYRANSAVYEQHIRTSMQISSPENILYLDPASHDYIQTVQTLLSEHDFNPKTLIIDMTGATPMISYIADALIPPYPWIIGGYDGSKHAAHFNLSLMESSTIAQAWILTARDGERRNIPLDLLSDFNLFFPDDYRLVGTMTFPTRNGEKHMLWKPRDSRSMVRTY